MANRELTAKDTRALAALHRSEILAEASGVGKRTPVVSAGSLKHGLIANRICTTEERVMFMALIEKFEADFDLNQSVDFMQTELVALYFIQLGRCVTAQDWENAERVDRMLRANLRDLKATKRAREGENANTGEQQSPAEWATALLERVAAGTAAGTRAAELQASERRGLPAKTRE